MNKFNSVIINGEILDGFQIIDTNWDKKGICKRCGKSFTKKYKKQTFCTADCCSKYHDKVREQFGSMKNFRAWLNKDLIGWKDYNEFSI